MSKITMAAAASVGFLLGSRAGRAPYEKARAQAGRLRRDPRVRQAVAQAGAVAQEKAGDAVSAAKQAASRSE